MPRYKLVDFLGFTPMNHRPPLPRRWGLYCAFAYLAPSITLQFVSAEDVPYRDLVWLLTLVPAFLLSLQFGMRGAAAGLVMGTLLFTAVQFLVALNLNPADWRVTLPICTPALVDIARYFFVNAMTTISAVVFLYSPQTKVASIAILNLDEAVTKQ